MRWTSGFPKDTGAVGVTAADAADGGEVPTALVAVTVNVYAVPLVKPATVELRPVGVIPVHAGHAGDGAIVYRVIGEPPSLTGAVHDTTADALPGTAVTPVGAPGTAAGVTAAEAADGGEVPTALVAVTVNVYAVPLVRPNTVELRPGVVIPVHAGHAGDDAIVYPVIAEPPSPVSYTHLTLPTNREV